MKNINLMLHALGISFTQSGKAVEPNKRYCPYPTSYRNYYQSSNEEGFEALVKEGKATFHKGDNMWQDCYFVTEKGKDYLKKIGYKWHEQKKKGKS